MTVTSIMLSKRPFKTRRPFSLRLFFSWTMSSLMAKGSVAPDTMHPYRSFSYITYVLLFENRRPIAMDGFRYTINPFVRSISYLLGRGNFSHLLDIHGVSYYLKGLAVDWTAFWEFHSGLMVSRYGLGSHVFVWSSSGVRRSVLVSEQWLCLLVSPRI